MFIILILEIFIILVLIVDIATVNKKLQEQGQKITQMAKLFDEYSSSDGTIDDQLALVQLLLQKWNE